MNQLVKLKTGASLFRSSRWFASVAMPPISQQRVTSAAIVGLPNAGKSSLLNALLAKRVAAVSRKRNTTRENLLAVASDSTSGIQIVFYDTPGFVGHKVGGEAEKRRVERSIITSARAAVGSEGNSLTLVVIDAAKKLTDLHESQIRELLTQLVQEACRRDKMEGMSPTEMAKDVASCFTIVLNKVDLVNPKYNLLLITEELLDLFKGVVWSCVPASKKRVSLGFDCFYVSATASDPKTNGLQELRHYLHEASIPARWDSIDDDQEDGGKVEQEAEDYDDEDEEEGDYYDDYEDDDDDDYEEDDDDYEEDDDDYEEDDDDYEEDDDDYEDDDDDYEEDDDDEDDERMIGDSKRSTKSSSSVYDSVSCELDDVTFASECIREKIFTYVHKEVPYVVSQVNRVWEMSRDGKRLRIQNDLVVKTRSQKKMVIGPKGEVLKLIAQSAERDLSEHFGVKVELKLWVRERGTSKA